ncbi:hypothetical protein SCANM63S_04472 [Streptomyces canarius]
MGQTAAVSAFLWITVVSLAAWCWLLLGQGFFWRTDVRLPGRRGTGRVAVGLCGRTGP